MRALSIIGIVLYAILFVLAAMDANITPDGDLFDEWMGISLVAIIFGLAVSITGCATAKGSR